MVTPGKPRVLLLEDDASLQRFVAMVLEELPIELVVCGSVSAAATALDAGPFQLVIADLMLPGESGEVLLERLAHDPAWGGGPRRVVFSAGLDGTRRARLQALGVWRFLGKPVGVVELEACVTDALAGDATQAEPGPILAPDADAIVRNFGGNEALYRAFLASCRAQFPIDVQAGDAALAAADWAALRRLGHSLKTVLLTLGQRELSGRARAMDEALAAGNTAEAAAAWPALREGLIAGVREGDGPSCISS